MTRGSERRRVAITGIGAVTPVGSGVEGLWAGVRSGRSAVAAITRFDASPFRARVAAEVRDFIPREWMDERRARRLDRYSQFAVAVARQAVADADLRLESSEAHALRQRMGCYVGSALGGVAFAEEQHQAYVAGGLAAVHPSLALAVFGGAGASNAAMALGLHGPSIANSNSCASGAIAIGEAFRLVRAGQAPAMIAAGAEVPLAPLTFGAFAVIRAMSTANDCPGRASRPFDADRDGFVMGEGAAALVLEDLDHARARGARVYAEMLGYGISNDAFNMLAPLADGSQAARAIQDALADAEVDPDEVDYVNAHASGTPIGDRAEAAAIRLGLGDVGERVPVSGTKGAYGHPLGASGAIETALAALAIARGHLPGTVNFTRSESEMGALNVLPPEGVPGHPRVVLKNAFGFGGINAALVLADPERI